MYAHTTALQQHRTNTHLCRACIDIVTKFLHALGAHFLQPWIQLGGVLPLQRLSCELLATLVRYPVFVVRHRVIPHDFAQTYDDIHPINTTID